MFVFFVRAVLLYGLEIEENACEETAVSGSASPEALMAPLARTQLSALRYRDNLYTHVIFQASPHSRYRTKSLQNQYRYGCLMCWNFFYKTLLVCVASKCLNIFVT